MSNFVVSYVVKAVDQFTRPLEKMQGSITGFSSKLHGLVEGVVGGYMMKQVMNIEEMQKKLMFVTGSASDTAKMLAKIKAIGSESGIDLEQLTQAGVKFLAMGKSVNEAGETLEKYSRIAEGTGTSIETISSMITRLDIMAKSRGGAVSPRSIIMLAENNVALMKTLKQMALEAGYTDAKFNKLFSSASGGKIGLQLMYKALDRISQQTPMDTLTKELERFHNILRITTSDILLEILPIEKMKYILGGTADNSVRLENSIKNFVAQNSQLLKVLTTISLIAIAITPLTMVFRTLTPLIVTAFSPIGIAIGSVVLLIAKFEVLQDIIIKIGDTLNQFVSQDIAKAFKVFPKETNVFKNFLGGGENDIGGMMHPGISSNPAVEQYLARKNETAKHELTVKIDDPKGYVKQVAPKASGGTMRVGVNNQMVAAHA